MENPITTYWQKRLNELKVALEKNNFSVFLANDTAEARRIVQEQILPGLDAKTVSFGGSMTFMATGLYDFFKTSPDYQVLDTFDKTIPRPEMVERRRQALLVDLFFTGTNAITEGGQLVNLDMQGNRVAAITHGPRNVVLLVGRNKLVADLEAAFARIKNYVAPVNTMRLGMKTPCVATSYCEECASPERICNSWVITEKSFPKGRTRIILVNEDLGL
ncbi:MAG: lactate utilization protein [Pseudomonadota bacterium]